MPRLLSLLPAIVAVSGGCRGPGSAGVMEARAPGPVRLSFVADFNPPRPPRSPETLTAGAAWDQALGGLSGLHYDARDAILYAISDGRARFPPRLYTFTVELTDHELRMVPRSVVLLHERAPSGVLVDLDCESIAEDAHGSLYIGTENHDDQPTQRWPRILQLDQDGLITHSLPLPTAFLPEVSDVPTRGPYSNEGFEGLAVSPSGRWLYAITEEGLRQDGPLATFEQGTSPRLLRWDLHAPGAPAEFAYRTEPVPRPRSGTPLEGLNGVSALTSLDDDRLLVLERAYVDLAEGPDPNTIRIFETTLPAASAGSAAPPQLSPKRLVLDLDDIVGQLDPRYPGLDNFEGMTLGPTLPSGERSLLLVSDDNFSDHQRTVFLAFRLATDAPTH